DDGVEAVVAAGELQDDQDVVVGLVRAADLLGEGELRDEGGDGGGEADDGEGTQADLQQVAASGLHWASPLNSGGRSPPYESWYSGMHIMRWATPCTLLSNDCLDWVM